MRWRRRSHPALTGRVHRRRAQLRAGLPAHRRALSRRAPIRRTRSRKTCGVPASTIRRIAAELAHVAFEEAIELPVAWTDWAGRRHETMRGRPIAMHAMRGISAHSNGFHTCRALHLLQVLLGTVDVPGGFRFKPPYPKPIPPGNKPAGKDGGKPNTPLPGSPLGFVTSPDDLLDRRSRRAGPHRQGLFVGGAARRPRHDAHGDRQRLARRSLPDRHALHVHGQHGVELVDEHGGHHRHAHRQETRDGDYKIPFIIYSDAYFSETVAYADLVLPDTTYLERHDCISLLDRPIGDADGPGDAIRHPVVEPDRDVRPFQSVLLDLGARLKLPGMVDEAGEPKYRDYADYIVSHERAPGIGPLAGWRGADGEVVRARRAQSRPACSATSRMAASGATSSPTTSAITRWRTAPISTSPSRWASWRSPSRSSSSSIRSRCSASALPRAATEPSSRRRASASASRPTSIRCPSGTRRSRRR